MNIIFLNISINSLHITSQFLIQKYNCVICTFIYDNKVVDEDDKVVDEDNTVVDEDNKVVDEDNKVDNDDHTMVNEEIDRVCVEVQEK
jgi:hypothetical protein